MSLGSRKRRIEIIIPLEYNDKREIEHTKFFETKQELLNHFGGFSYLTGSFGSWRSPDGMVYSDRSTLFVVAASDSQNTLEFVRQYKKKLERRFQQQAIMFTHYRIYTL